MVRSYCHLLGKPADTVLAEAGVALDELLDLLALSDVWDIQELKSQAVRRIVDLKLVRLETCDAGELT